MMKFQVCKVISCSVIPEFSLAQKFLLYILTKIVFKTFLSKPTMKFDRFKFLSGPHLEIMGMFDWKFFDFDFDWNCFPGPSWGHKHHDEVSGL